MKLLEKLAKNKNAKISGCYLIGNMLNKAIAFLTIPIFTRILSTSDYGIVNTYLSWVSILTLLVGLSLGSAIRSAYVDFYDDLDGFISSVFFLSLASFFVSSSLILLGCCFVKKVDMMLVVLCLVQSYMTFIINSMSIKYMMTLEYKKGTLLLSLPNIVITFFGIIWIMNMNSSKYLGRILPYVLVNLAVGCVYLAIYFIKGKKFIDKKYWKYALALSIPLIIHGLSVTILSTSDRTIITVFRGASEAGVYSLIYNLSMVATAVTAALENVWIPWFTGRMQNNDKQTINDKVKMYIGIVVVLMIGIVMAGPEVLVIMAPQSYWGGKVLIPPILLASFFIFLYSISVDLEYYYKNTKNIAANTIVAAAVNIVLNLVLVPKYGATAAAYTTVVAYIISFLLHYRAARKLDNELFHFSTYVKPIILMVVSVIVAYVFMDYWIIRWAIALLVCVYYLAANFKRLLKKNTETEISV